MGLGPRLLWVWDQDYSGSGTKTTLGLAVSCEQIVLHRGAQCSLPGQALTRPHSYFSAGTHPQGKYDTRLGHLGLLMKGLEPEWPNLNVLLITHNTRLGTRLTSYRDGIIELQMHDR